MRFILFILVFCTDLVKLIFPLVKQPVPPKGLFIRSSFRHDVRYSNIYDTLLKDGWIDVHYTYVFLDIISSCYRIDEKITPGAVEYQFFWRDTPEGKYPIDIKNEIQDKGMKFGIVQKYYDEKIYDRFNVINNTKMMKEQKCNPDLIEFEYTFSKKTDPYDRILKFVNEFGEQQEKIEFSCHYPKTFVKLSDEVLQKTANVCENWMVHDGVTSINTLLAAIELRRLYPMITALSGPGHWVSDGWIHDSDYSGADINFPRLQYFQLVYGVFTILPSPIWLNISVERLLQNDLPDFFKTIFQNKLLDEIHQDSLTRPGRMMKQEGDIQVWTRKVRYSINEYHAYMIALINWKMDGRETLIELSLKSIGLKCPYGYHVIEIYNKTPNNTFGYFSAKHVMTINLQFNKYRFLYAIPNGRAAGLCSINRLLLLVWILLFVIISVFRSAIK